MSRQMSATDGAYADTRTRIIDGGLSGGEVITEGQISAWLGISRTPVREAFLRLQSEGFLQLYPKRGAVVVPIAASEAVTICEAREVIETFAVEKILTEQDSTPQALLDQLWSYVVDQGRFSRSGDFTAFSAADTAFHVALIDAAQNPHLTYLYAGLRDRHRRVAMSTTPRQPTDLRAVQASHHQLVELLERGDLDAMLSAVRAHLRGVLKDLEQGIRPT